MIGFFSYNIAVDEKIIEMKSINRKNIGFMVGIPIMISALFSYFQYKKLNREMDIKYTPLYLKSKGRI